MTVLFAGQKADRFMPAKLMKSQKSTGIDPPEPLIKTQQVNG